MDRGKFEYRGNTKSKVIADVHFEDGSSYKVSRGKMFAPFALRAILVIICSRLDHENQLDKWL